MRNIDAQEKYDHSSEQKLDDEDKNAPVDGLVGGMMLIQKALIIFILLEMCYSFNVIKNMNKFKIQNIAFWIFLLVVALEVNAQTNFNYVGNGDYKQHGCTVA